MVILPEYERRSLAPRTAHQQMKEGLRRLQEEDTTLVGGFFNMPTVTSRAGTFGRAPRFSSAMAGEAAHLTYDVQRMQGTALRNQNDVLTASARGVRGANVTSRWNDPNGGAAPGPGAYTPRFSQVSLPARR
jgi:hypothetical protein